MTVTLQALENKQQGAINTLIISLTNLDFDWFFTVIFHVTHTQIKIVSGHLYGTVMSHLHISDMQLDEYFLAVPQLLVKLIEYPFQGFTKKRFFKTLLSLKFVTDMVN